ncbi:MAG: hypothetical protein CL849_03035 [Crocinitomicaceae bacterium]|nr:hypothetical protein [Crocinitomicaceae bacterium]
MMGITQVDFGTGRILWIAVLAAVGGIFDVVRAAHPQDGPHVDLRIVIEDDRVILNVEMNLVFLDAMVDLDREDPARISREEWADVPMVLEDHFLNDAIVRIDGVRIDPELEGLQINDPDLRLLPLFPVSGEQGLRKIRFELVYPTPGSPADRVEIVWTTYPPDILKDLPDPPPIAIAAEVVAEGLRVPFVISADEPAYTWYRRGGDLESRLAPVPAPATPIETSWPILAIGLTIFAVGCMLMALGGPRPVSRNPGWLAFGTTLIAAAVVVFVVDVGTFTTTRSIASPDGIKAEEIFRPLHQNIYRAFDYVEEGSIYDALARTADADFVDTLYRTIFRGLVMEEEGGAVARVARVRPLEIEVLESGVEKDSDGREWPSFRVRCRWLVDGVVTHWGHSHARTNEYDAIWSVGERPGGWRLTGAEITRQDRVEDGIDDEFEL